MLLGRPNEFLVGKFELTAVIPRILSKSSKTDQICTRVKNLLYLKTNIIVKNICMYWLEWMIQIFKSHIFSKESCVWHSIAQKHQPGEKFFFFFDRVLWQMRRKITFVEIWSRSLRLEKITYLICHQPPEWWQPFGLWMHAGFLFRFFQTYTPESLLKYGAAK